MQLHRHPILRLVPRAVALIAFSCKSPEPMNGPAQPASAASAEPRARSAAPVPSPAEPVPTASASAVAPAISASAVKEGAKYPDDPCKGSASDFRQYTECWAEAVGAVRDDLDATVLAERTQDAPLNPVVAALVRDQEKWEKKRDARCNAKDNGQMGQGMGSIGQLSVARCRYEADRKRLADFQAARDKP